MIYSLLTGFFLLSGVFFVLVGAIGTFRMPDFYTRTHAAAKAGAFGGSLILIAACLFFLSFSVYIKVLLTIIFFYLTTPVASHMLGRGAYLSRARMWEGTHTDELKGRYDLKNRRLLGRASDAVGGDPDPGGA